MCWNCLKKAADEAAADDLIKEIAKIAQEKNLSNPTILWALCQVSGVTVRESDDPGEVYDWVGSAVTLHMQEGPQHPWHTPVHLN